MRKSILTLLVLLLMTGLAASQQVRFSVGTNASLQSTATTAVGAAVVRQGYTTAGDAPPLTYAPSSLPCSLNSGNGDNGSQVKSADNKCWLAVFPSGSLDSRWWGVAQNAMNLYASAAGNDNGGANYCFNVSLPCTHQGALNQAMKLDGQGNSPTVNLVAGTYTTGLVCFGPMRGQAAGTFNPPTITISGASSATTILADASSAAAAIIASDYCNLILTKLKITSVNGSGIFPQRSARIAISTDVNFGATAHGQLHPETGAVVEIASSYTISGGAPSHLQPTIGGQVVYDENATTVTLTGTPAFSTAFAQIADRSFAYIPSGFITFSGAATGGRALITGNSVIETNSGGAAYLPGNAAIAYSSNGVYLPMPQPTLGTLTGLGGSGTAAVISGGTDYGVLIQLSPAAGAAATGNVQVNFAGSLSNAACVATTSPGTGSWQAASTAVLGGFGGAASVTVTWQNNAVALTNGSTYLLSLICRN